MGELRDRCFENQRFSASGLNLVTAAIVLWNTGYLGRPVYALKEHGHFIDQRLLRQLSPLGWEHINLTGDNSWRADAELQRNGYRPLGALSGTRRLSGGSQRIYAFVE